MVALNGREFLNVTGVTSTGLPSGETFQTTTQAIANLGSGGGGGFVKNDRIVTTGSSDTADFSDGYVGWNSNTAAPKTQHIPTSTGSKQVIIIKDVAYNSDVYPITISPATGGIDGFSSVDISTPGGSLMMLDTTIGWSLIG